jgi:hypothetical protein
MVYRLKACPRHPELGELWRKLPFIDGNAKAIETVRASARAIAASEIDPADATDAADLIRALDVKLSRIVKMIVSPWRMDEHGNLSREIRGV